MASIPKITEEQRARLKRASVYALSTRPSEQGKKEADIKNAMYAPNEMVCDFIDLIVDSINIEVGGLSKTVGEIKATIFENDEITTQIAYTLANNVVKTYSATAASVVITMPDEINAGFAAGIEFFTGDTPPQVTVNPNAKNVSMFQYGTKIGQYSPAKNARIAMYAYSNNGEYVDIFILEA